MGDDNYDRLLEKIAGVSGIEKSELERRVEAKRAKLSGFISKEGAAQIIAAELGISFDKEKLKIDELLPGMRKVNVVGKIINVFPIRTFTSKKGEAAKVANLIIADNTSNAKVVLWDTNHISLFEEGKIKQGDVVEIASGSMRDSEIHLGSFSELKLSQENLLEVITERAMKEKKIADFRVGDSSKVRAFIVQMFEPRFFYVCSECGKKVVSGVEGFLCQEHGKIAAEKRALMNIVLDDGTENIRAVLFTEAIGSIGINLEENMFLDWRERLLGKEMFFSGNVRNNKFFNNTEFIVDGAKEIDLDEVIGKLEKNG